VSHANAFEFEFQRGMLETDLFDSLVQDLDGVQDVRVWEHPDAVAVARKLNTMAIHAMPEQNGIQINQLAYSCSREYSRT
jgi:hypothetical protein